MNEISFLSKIEPDGKLGVCAHIDCEQRANIIVHLIVRDTSMKTQLCRDLIAFAKTA